MLKKLRCTLLLALLLLMHGTLPSLAAQGSGCMPTTGTVSGLAFAQGINAAIASLISSNSGASPPITDCSGVSITGQLWVDTSTTPRVLKQYDGTNWLVIGVLDSTNHIWTPPVGGGIATLASSSTVDLGSVPQAYVSVTGSTGPITSFGSSAVAGTLKVVSFASTPTITYDATSMILPGTADLTTSTGDVWLVAYLGSGKWRVVSVQQASGQSVVSLAIPVGGQINFTGFTPPAKYVLGYGQALSRSSYPDYLAAVTLTQSASRTSGSAVLSSVGDTSQFGPGMPIEGAGIPNGATIGSMTSTTIAMASTCGAGSSACNASSSGTNNITVFAHGYGAGGNTTTVGVIDCRGRSVAGRENMGGTSPGRLTTALSGINGTQLGAAGGAAQSSILQTHLPPVSPTFTGQTETWNLIDLTFGNVPGNTFVSPGNLGSSLFTPRVTITPHGTISPLGDGTPLIVQNNTVVANCIVRVLQ